MQVAPHLVRQLAGDVAVAFQVGAGRPGQVRRTEHGADRLAGQLGGALAAAAGACWFLSLRFPASARGTVPLLGLLLGGLCMNGVLYADLPLATALLLAAAPLGAWVPVPAAAERPRRALAARMALVALLAGAGVVVAKVLNPPMDY